MLVVRFLEYGQNTNNTEYHISIAGTNNSNYTKSNFIFLVCVSMHHTDCAYGQQESQHSAHAKNRDVRSLIHIVTQIGLHIKWLLELS
jgi:hypothetical protein